MDSYLNLKSSNTIDDDLILFSNSTIFKSIAILKRGRLVKIKNAKTHGVRFIPANSKAVTKKSLGFALTKI